MITFHIYLEFPKEAENHITSIEDGKKLMKELQAIIDRVDCEKGSILYYDSLNKDTFFDEVTTLEDIDLIGNFGCYSFEQAVNLLLNESDVIDWRKKPLHDIEEKVSSYRKWNNLTINIENDFSESLKEIAERKTSNNEFEKIIFVDPTKQKKPLEFITIIINQRNTFPQKSDIEYAPNFILLDEWLTKNRAERKFNMDDYRHIENNPKYIKGKSPLIGGIGGRINAKKLLFDALGDKRLKKYLINFDPTNNLYIRYEDENANNQYHGYHLVEPKTHKEDFQEVQKISKKILSIIKYKNELKNIN